MIEVRAVVKRFGEVPVLEGVSLELERGASLGILGASGSGKTTLLRIIAGLELPESGEVLMDGRVVSRRGWGMAPHRRGLGFVFQSPALWPHMTVAGNVSFGLRSLAAPEARARLGRIIEDTGLGRLEQRYPAQLSGGQARRVAIARALAPQPEWLLMDEPLSNLDRAARDEMLALVEHIVAESRAGLIYVTHDESELERLACRVLRLTEGRLIGDETR
jgi:ABC-type Fe3+/spermidine/putrescine transport system ATPase subunit